MSKQCLARVKDAPPPKECVITSYSIHYTKLYDFNLLMKVHKVEKYKACATSAMREAYNGKEIVDLIKKKTDIKIDVIDGKKEATIIAASDLKQFINSEKTYLYVDVGGGSTEFSLFSGGKIVVSKSFKIGTVRLLNNMVSEIVWIEIENWIKAITKDWDEITLIGSGGNINKLFKLSEKHPDKPLSYVYLSSQYQKLNSIRITSYNVCYTKLLRISRASSRPPRYSR